MRFSKFTKYAPVRAIPLSEYRLKSYHIPLFHYRYISTAAFFLLLVAFIIFLLVALSMPIIKTIFLLEIIAMTDPKQPATSIATTIKFGVWGLCATRYVQA
jgi:hypothetical protein